MRDLSVANVMVVDDDPSTVSLLKSALTLSGVETVHCHINGLRALAQIIRGEQPVDLILCDLSMPHMDGVEFFRRLAELGYTGGLIVVSGEDERIINMIKKLARVQKLNLFGNLEKPVDAEAVRLVIDQWARHVPVPTRSEERRVGKECRL